MITYNLNIKRKHRKQNKNSRGETATDHEGIIPPVY